MPPTYPWPSEVASYRGRRRKSSVGQRPNPAWGRRPRAAGLLASSAGVQRPRSNEMTRTDHPQRNLAARMGRWSAGHWKTATFGWLALVVVAFGIGGAVGTKNIDPNTAGPGESGRMDAILDAGFKQPAGESVLIQSTTHEASDPALPGRDRGRRRRHLRPRRSPARAVAARPGQRRPDRAGRACRARRVPDPRRRRPGGGEDRPGPRPGGRGPAGPSRLLHRAVRRGERRGRRRTPRSPRTWRRPGSSRCRSRCSSSSSPSGRSWPRGSRCCSP